MRILVVEDSRVSRALLMRHLSQFGAVTDMGDGLEGLHAFKEALAENRGFELICLDLDLPGLDGLNLLSEIRRIESELTASADALGTARPVLAKVLIVTGSSDKETVKKLSTLNIDGYLLKPVDPARLAKIIEEFQFSEKAPASFDTDTAKALTSLCDADIIPVPLLARMIQAMSKSIERQADERADASSAAADA